MFIAGVQAIITPQVPYLNACLLQSDTKCLRGPGNTLTGRTQLTELARVAQSVERQTLNLVVAGSSPASGFLRQCNFEI